MMKILIILTLMMGSLFGATFNVSTTPEFRQALLDAAQNGQDDTIILADGTYKTTDDGQGTFIFLDNEDYNLTLKGSSAENVILSGESQHQIFNHNSTENAPLFLEKLSFVDGNNTEGIGGGVYTDFSIEVNDCLFTNNSAHDGGGISSSSSATVTNSTFTNNSASSNGHGGGFSTFNYDHSIAVTNSTFTNNSANYGGGFYSRSVTVTNSSFTNNHALGTRFYSGDGGGFYSQYHVTVTNSRFSNNSALGTEPYLCDGGGFYSLSATVTNSIFTNNSASGDGGGFSTYSTVVSNSIFNDNSSAINTGGEFSKIINNVFITETDDINGSSSTIISNLENNYIDLSKVYVPYFGNNNIHSGVNLGFVDQANEDYHLTASSDLVDAGNENVDGATLPATDLDGNARIAGSAIDIGPYEFSTTKPTITSFTYTGEAKEMSELVFDVQYSFSSGRSLGTVEFDFTGDGTYESRYAHTYTQAGTYTASVKITDNTGEFSIKSLEIIVAKISLEDKLLTVLTPSEVDTLMPWINEEVDTQVTNKIDTCKANPKSCGIKSGVVVIPMF